jgi:outer membrane protein assembly factor BamB
MAYLSRRGLLAATGGGLASVAAGILRPETVLPALAVDPQVPAGEWPMHKCDPARSGYQPEPGPREGVTERWSGSVGEGAPYVPGIAAAGRQVLTVARDGMWALSTEDGSPDWMVSADEDSAGRNPDVLRIWFPRGGPVVRDDRAFVVSGSDVYALSTEDGSPDWSFSTTSGFEHVLPVGNVVFAGASRPAARDDRLVALDRASGVPQWQRVAPEVPLAFAPDEGYLIGAAPSLDGSGTLIARNPVRGNPVWEASHPGSPLVSGQVIPTVGDGRVYGGRGPVVALSTADGSERWSAPIGDLDLRTGLVTDGDGLYLADGGIALALDAATGERRWITEAETTPLASPVLARETLYVPTPRGVTALRTESGTERFSYELDLPRWSVRGLIVADGRLYLRGERTVHALEGER